MLGGGGDWKLPPEPFVPDTPRRFYLVTRTRQKGQLTLFSSVAAPVGMGENFGIFINVVVSFISI